MKIVAAPPGSQKPEVVCELDDDLGSFSGLQGTIHDRGHVVLRALGPRVMAREFHVELPGRLLTGCRILGIRGIELEVDCLGEQPWDNE
jgi:hypothetical protein